MFFLNSAVLFEGFPCWKRVFALLPTDLGKSLSPRPRILPPMMPHFCLPIVRIDHTVICVHRGSEAPVWSSCLNLSITRANTRGFRVNPRCNPACTLNPSVILPHTSPLSYWLHTDPEPLLKTSLLTTTGGITPSVCPKRTSPDAISGFCFVVHKHLCCSLLDLQHLLVSLCSYSIFLNVVDQLHMLVNNYWKTLGSTCVLAITHYSFCLHCLRTYPFLYLQNMTSGVCLFGLNKKVAKFNLTNNQTNNQQSNASR